MFKEKRYEGKSKSKSKIVCVHGYILNMHKYMHIEGCLGGACCKKLSANAGDIRRGFDPWVRKNPWRTAWQPPPVFIPGESHGQESLAGYSPQGQKESDTTEATWRTCTHTHKEIKRKLVDMFSVFKCQNCGSFFNILACFCLFSSVQFSCSFVSESLRPHGLQHARLPCPSPIPRAYSNSCPLSW